MIKSAEIKCGYEDQSIRVRRNLYQRQVRRIFVLAVGIGGVVFTAALVRDRICFNYLLSLEHECLNYELPLHTPVFLMSGGRISNVASPWRNFSFAARSSDATIFLHGVHAPNGKTYLVAVDLRRLEGSKYSVFTSVLPVPSVVESCGRFEARRYDGFVPVGSLEVLDNRLCIISGKPDVLKPSHFLIEYRAGSVFGVIDGFLDSDLTVHLRQRHVGGSHILRIDVE